jgi:non-specific serine/threonine protein kinase
MTAPLEIANRFELGALLGSGSAADVFRARDRATGGEVAIKLALDRVHPEMARVRFEREAAALSVLGSPHVVRLVAAGLTEQARPWLALELLRGHTLEVELAHGPVAPHDVITRLTETAAALELAHGLGIIHRDLKPANLFLHTPPGGKPIVKVLDFGLAHDAAGVVRPDGVVGTPLYMAPEQVRAQVTRIGPSSDGWAVGMLAITLLTGETYWTGGSSQDVIGQIDTTPMYPPSTRWSWLPLAFDVWFARATHRVADRRFRSVTQQVAALARALADVDDATRPRRINRTALGGASTMIGTPTPSLLRSVPTTARPLIGRQIERGAIEARVVPGALVTLVGPAGVGKSRLAEAVAQEVGDRLSDGAWQVTLGGLAEAAAIPEAIAHVLGVEPDSTRPWFDQVVAALTPRRPLIVLDGAEHLRGAAAVIGALRDACPNTAWLVTSRIALELPGEQAVPVQPLDAPAPQVSPEEAASYPAVQLFVLRAGTFVLGEDNVGDVVAICRLVEGLPLCLELVAAQVRARSLAEVRARLEEASGGRDDPAGAAIAASYDLLGAPAQTLLRHLAVLPAGLAFPELRACFGHITDDPAGAVVRILESGLASWSSDDPPRLTMLDRVRELCRLTSERLDEDGAIWRAAFAYLRERTASAEAGLRGDDQERWLAALDAEHDNLRAAIDHALDAEPATALALAGSLAWYWYLRGDYDDGAALLAAALSAAGNVPDAARLRALHGAGRLALLQCSYTLAAALLDEARSLARTLADPRGEAEAAQLLGSVARERGDYAQARHLHRRSLELWLQLGDPREAARTLNYLAFVAWLGEPDGRPTAPIEEAEVALRTLGDVEGIVWALLNRGAIAFYRDDLTGARTILEEAFAEAAAVRFQEGIAWSLDLLARISLVRGERLQARAQLHAALRVQRRLGDLWRCASILEALAALHVDDARPARGAVYLGTADALRTRLGVPTPACERALRARCETAGRAALGDAFEAGRIRGTRTRLDDLVAG